MEIVTLQVVVPPINVKVAAQTPLQEDGGGHIVGVQLVAEQKGKDPAHPTWHLGLKVKYGVNFTRLLPLESSLPVSTNYDHVPSAHKRALSFLHALRKMLSILESASKKHGFSNLACRAASGYQVSELIPNLFHGAQRLLSVLIGPFRRTWRRMACLQVVSMVASPSQVVACALVFGQGSASLICFS